MDRLTKLRRVSRSNITKSYNKITEELNKAVKDKQMLLLFREEIIRFADVITIQDNAIIEALVDGDFTDDYIDTENEEILVYRNKITLAEIKINEYMKSLDVVPENGHNQNVIVNEGDDDRVKKTYKLPKIEIKKFNGELLDWLSFWSQFEKIHKDKNLDESDKFQYLAQTMSDGTRAKELVNSYPQTAGNYPKVIIALKERFGKTKILKQVYVRELIKMIAINVNGQNKIMLTTLFDSLESHIRALETLGVTMEQTSEFLFPLVESSLPEEILIAWQRSINYGKDGTTEVPPKTETHYLMNFLKQEVESEQQRLLARVGFLFMTNKTQENKSDEIRQIKEKSNIPTAASLYVGDSHHFVFCEKTHLSQECIKAMSMSLDEKMKILKEKNACLLCLKNHNRKPCRAWIKCSGCAKQHYHLLCPDSINNSGGSSAKGKNLSGINQSGITSSIPNNNNSNVVVLNSNQIRIGQVLLKTLLVNIKTNVGNKTVRVLFDDGSQQSYIKTSVAIEGKCKEKGKYFERNTLFGGILSNIEERTIYQVKIKSLDDEVKYDVQLPDKEIITGKIIKLPKGFWLDELEAKGIYINDQDTACDDVDILIGADLIPLLISDESITLQSGLKAVKTVFGWTVMGPIPNAQVTLSQTMLIIHAQLDETRIKDLWDLELIGINDLAIIKSKEERELQAETHFIQTVERNEEGRYRVALPWVDGHQEIPNNFIIAQKRLMYATKKLKKDGMFENYDGIFKQWEDIGFIEKTEIQAEEYYSIRDCHFIPHHPVYKPSSKTTPVRPVFDASCKLGRYPSLNECLEKGPNLIEFIPKIMFLFREGRFGVLSDIWKAFQMIEIQEDDRKYLMFLWWEDNTCTKLKTFKHKRVVFGVKSSPFILAAVISYHLDRVTEKDKPIAQKLKSSFYVDNSITSVNSIEEYLQFRDNATRILAEAKLELRQWEHTNMEIYKIKRTNDESFAPSSLPQITFKEEGDLSSVLGMKWNKKKDTLSCATIPELPDTLTKRTLLASINKIFDPLGMLSPALIYPKIILQLAWNQKIDWEDELPIDLKNRFYKWCNELCYFEDIQIPRYIKDEGFCKENSNIQLHIFNDASKIAFATVMFLRTETRGKVSVKFLQAKARISPINKLTIPRLELMGCVIGARLAKNIYGAQLEQFPSFYWCDSSTALAWIKRNDNWGTFVGNRVREILQLSDSVNWHHIPGKLNPADLPSRGCSPRSLSNSEWWDGPQWLKLPQSQWPSEEFIADDKSDDDEIPIVRSRSGRRVQKPIRLRY